VLDLPEALPFLAVAFGTVAALCGAYATSKAHDAAQAGREVQRRRRQERVMVDLVERTPSDTMISRK
jgi:hypothetical protein